MPYLSQKEVFRILHKYDVPYLHSHFFRSEKELHAASNLEYPLVMKIESPDIVHKSDAGGVIAGIRNHAELLHAYPKMMGAVKKKFPKAKIRGVMLQKQLAGKEVIIGVKRDPVFGPVVLFGSGGIFVEVLKDVSFRVAPVNKDEAREMIDEIKLAKILYGIRGERPVAINKLVQLIMKVSVLALKEKSLQEMDLNPVIADQRQAIVVDARMLFK